MCSLCDRNIQKSIKVRCFECSDPAVTLCFECFRTGAENGAHKSTHDYFVLDNLNFNLFTKDWTAKEELLLIQGIMKCGMGNWVDIAEQYVKTKDPKMCEEHYFSFFYKSKDDNLPNLNDTIFASEKKLKNMQFTVELNEEKASQGQL